MTMLDAKSPSGPLEAQWSSYRDHLKLVAPNNRRKFEVVIVGSGLAGAAAAATLGEAGYNVKCFCFQDSPRRAHSIAAQGGINAAKNYRNDGDSTFRLFYDTIKGGDFRSRESNVYRLAEVSVEIIDPRTLHPFDLDTVLRSLRKTGRLLVVHESPVRCGVGGDIVRRVCGAGFELLRQAPQVIGGMDSPIPFSKPLEDAVIPQVSDIRAAIEAMVE